MSEKDEITNHQFYFETPLYEVVELDGLEDGFLSQDVDAYSAKNNTDTTYSIVKEGVDVWSVWDKSISGRVECGFYLVKLECKRKENDVIRFIIYKDDKIVLKIGQWPSLADLQFSELDKKYNKVLDNENLKNLKKAIGLVAHGTGAGSFVYLRRIFENLIFEAFNAYKDNLSVVNDFKTMRMEDKIELLKEYLPSQLIEMKSVYGILSKGVHELSEEDCLKYFVPIKLSIILILDQKIEEKKKAEKDAEVKKTLQTIQQSLNTKKENEK